MMNASTKQEQRKVGEDWLFQQASELMEHGVPGLHFYTLGKPDLVYNVMKKLT